MFATNPPVAGLLSGDAAANSAASLARANERTSVNPIVEVPGYGQFDLTEVKDDYLDLFFRMSRGVGNLAIQVMYEQQRRDRAARDPELIRALFEGPRTRRLV